MLITELTSKTIYSGVRYNLVTLASKVLLTDETLTFTRYSAMTLEKAVKAVWMVNAWQS